MIYFITTLYCATHLFYYYFSNVWIVLKSYGRKQYLCLHVKL